MDRNAPPQLPSQSPSVRGLVDTLSLLRSEALEAEARAGDELASLSPGDRESARNLVHYLAVRARDLREIQRELTVLGLSSLGRLEPHVLPSLGAVLGALRSIGRSGGAAGDTPGREAFDAADRRLIERTEALLGKPPVGAAKGGRRRTRIMVTLTDRATDPATDLSVVRELVAAGMDVARIDCRHGGADEWRRIVANVRTASAELGRSCKVLVDLVGPELRTGPIAPGPEVVELRPHLDELGRVLQPARVLLSAEPLGAAAVATGTPTASGPAPRSAMHGELTGEATGGRASLPNLAIGGRQLAELREGDELHFDDARGRKRVLHVHQRRGDGVIAVCQRGSYVTPGTVLVHVRDRRELGRGAVGRLAAKPRAVFVGIGEELLLTAQAGLGQPELRGPEGEIISPARIGCTVREVFRDARIGQRVLFDGGRIEGVIRHRNPDLLGIEVTRTDVTGGLARLDADRPINLPDTEIDVLSLTERDRIDLDFAIEHADCVALSFVRTPRDVEVLQEELLERGASRLGIVLKIETATAFEELPNLLLAGLRTSRVGLMAVREGLGVELGLERLAEVQEEILWLAEAAHVPVIWASQVLESLATTGSPSRAEVTDAAMAGRAECVMLNDGPFVVDAVRFLDDVNGRMHEHQEKKRSMLRRLRLAGVGRSAPEPLDAVGARIGLRGS